MPYKVEIPTYKEIEIKKPLYVKIPIYEHIPIYHHFLVKDRQPQKLNKRKDRKLTELEKISKENLDNEKEE